MFKYHNKLNPLLWEDDKLKTNVKMKLIDIYQLFVSKLKENKIPIDVIDVLLLGSNASYNYTDNSDIDLHIVVDFNEIPLDKNVTQIFYNNEKSKFNNDYNVTIKGLPVEIYIEDINAGTLSNGIYSLLQDKWIKFPEYNPPKDIDYSKLLNYYNNKISNILLSDSSEEVKNLLNEIKMLRKISLIDNGEYSKGNLVFKELRNNGSIEQLYNKLKELTSKELSLEKINVLKEISTGDKIFYKFILFTTNDKIINELQKIDNKYTIEQLEDNLFIIFEDIIINDIINPRTCTHPSIQLKLNEIYNDCKILCNGAGSTRDIIDFTLSDVSYLNCESFIKWCKRKNIKIRYNL